MAEEFMYVDADTGKKLDMPTRQNNPYVPSGQTQRGDKADLLEKIRPDAIVEVIRHKLMGEQFNQETKKWVKIEALKRFFFNKGRGGNDR